MKSNPFKLIIAMFTVSVSVVTGLAYCVPRMITSTEKSTKLTETQKKITTAGVTSVVALVVGCVARILVKLFKEHVE